MKKYNDFLLESFDNQKLFNKILKILKSYHLENKLKFSISESNLEIGPNYLNLIDFLEENGFDLKIKKDDIVEVIDKEQKNLSDSRYKYLISSNKFKVLEVVIPNANAREYLDIGYNENGKIFYYPVYRFKNLTSKDKIKRSMNINFVHNRGVRGDKEQVASKIIILDINDKQYYITAIQKLSHREFNLLKYLYMGENIEDATRYFCTYYTTIDFDIFDDLDN